MSYTVSIHHIDTCLSCYLTDHHNRPGEVLIGVPVTAATTYAEALEQLVSEWDNGGLNEDVDIDVAEAIDVAFGIELLAFTDMLRQAGRLHKPFAPPLEPDDGSDDGEGPQAWFLIKYAGDDPDEDAEDAAIAAERLSEIAADPAKLVSGADLVKRLDAWVGTAAGEQQDKDTAIWGYTGFVNPEGHRVVNVHAHGGFGADLPMCLDVRNHSPSGFAWGYEGSGPAQLALAILCNAVGVERAVPLYQMFKRAVVSHWPQEGNWSITRADILDLVERRESAEAASAGEGA